MAKPSAEYLRDMHTGLENLSEELEQIERRLGKHYAPNHDVIRSLTNATQALENALYTLDVEVTAAEREN